MDIELDTIDAQMMQDSESGEGDEDLMEAFEDAAMELEMSGHEMEVEVMMDIPAAPLEEMKSDPVEFEEVVMSEPPTAVHVHTTTIESNVLVAPNLETPVVSFLAEPATTEEFISESDFANNIPSSIVDHASQPTHSPSAHLESSTIDVGQVSINNEIFQDDQENAELAPQAEEVDLVENNGEEPPNEDVDPDSSRPPLKMYPLVTVDMASARGAQFADILSSNGVLPTPAVILNVNGYTLSAFQEHAVENPTGDEVQVYPTVFTEEERQHLYYAQFDAFIKELRKELGDEVSLDKELAFHFTDLGFVLTEDNIYTQRVTLFDLDRIHVGCGIAGPLTFSLEILPNRFSGQFNALIENMLDPSKGGETEEPETNEQVADEPYVVDSAPVDEGVVAEEADETTEETYAAEDIVTVQDEVTSEAPPVEQAIEEAAVDEHDSAEIDDTAPDANNNVAEEIINKSTPTELVSTNADSNLADPLPEQLEEPDQPLTNNAQPSPPPETKSRTRSASPTRQARIDALADLQFTDEEKAMLLKMPEDEFNSFTSGMEIPEEDDEEVDGLEDIGEGDVLGDGWEAGFPENENDEKTEGLLGTENADGLPALEADDPDATEAEEVDTSKSDSNEVVPEPKLEQEPVEESEELSHVPILEISTIAANTNSEDIDDLFEDEGKGKRTRPLDDDVEEVEAESPNSKRLCVDMLV